MTGAGKVLAGAGVAIFVLQSCVAANAITRKRGAAPELIVCGMTGCFEVPRGCRYEMRRVGRHGAVAVVICDRR